MKVSLLPLPTFDICYINQENISKQEYDRSRGCRAKSGWSRDMWPIGKSTLKAKGQWSVASNCTEHCVHIHVMDTVFTPGICGCQQQYETHANTQTWKYTQKSFRNISVAGGFHDDTASTSTVKLLGLLSLCKWLAVLTVSSEIYEIA